MVNVFSPASFTKNFGWETDYSPLYHAIRSGFRNKALPTRVETWRAQSGLPDEDRELIPLRFFLFSQIGLDGDYVVPDELVLRSLDHGYGSDFDRLALFAFHLARSGRWRRSKWPGGRVAGWANDYIRTQAWKNDAWRYEAFTDPALENYIRLTVRGQRETLHKVFTNYRHMLRIAGVLDGGLEIGPIPFAAGSWAGRACKLLWDRAIYSDELDENSNEVELVEYFLLSEGFKLLGSSMEQGKAIAGLAAAEYRRDGGIHRF